MYVVILNDVGLQGCDWVDSLWDELPKARERLLLKMGELYQQGWDRPECRIEEHEPNVSSEREEPPFAVAYYKMVNCVPTEVGY